MIRYESDNWVAKSSSSCQRQYKTQKQRTKPNHVPTPDPEAENQADTEFMRWFNKLSNNKRRRTSEICDAWPSIRGKTAYYYDHCRSVWEMSRESKHKIKALKDGSIRPFLLIVSLHPFRRAWLAAQVGLELTKQKFYGDAHKEARFIITTARKGVQGRTNEAWTETINPAAKDCNWYQTTYRCSKRATKHYNKVSHGGEIRKSVKQKKRDFKGSILACQIPFSHDMWMMEETLILSVLRMAGLYQQVNKAKLPKKEKELMCTEDYSIVVSRLQKFGWKDASLIHMAAVHTLNPGMAMRKYWKVLSPFLDSRKDKVFRTKEVVGYAVPCICIPIALLLGGLGIIGLCMIARNTVSIIFRKETGDILPLVMLLALQRMWLNIGGVTIDDYYPKA